MTPGDDPGARWAARLARARRAERLLIRLGWLVIAVSAIGIVAEIVAIASGYDDVADGVVALAGLVLGGILTGAVAFGSGVNVGINAERLEREIAREGVAPGGAGPTAGTGR